MKATLVWAAVAVICIVAALSVGLSFAGWKDSSILGWTVGIGVFATTVFGLMAKIESKTDDQSKALESIESKADVAAVKSGEIAQRINGELDQRIEDACEKTVAQVIAALRKEGVLR